MTGILLGIFAAVALALGLFSYWEHLLISQHTKAERPAGSISWLDFFAKGKDAGFSNMEVKLLYELAKKSNMEHPAALFWSHLQMDNCIKYIVRRYRKAGTFNSEENASFLDKLFEFRKKMEMEKPKWKRGISSTTEIGEMQRLQIIAGRHGTFESRILKNTSKEMLIERPDSSSLPVHFKWKGQHVRVYFWRKEDAAYSFETAVSSESFSNDMSDTLSLLHTEKIERTQSRSNIRINTNKSARMFIIEGDCAEDTAEKKASSKSIHCKLKDLSDNGCSVLVGGEAKNYFKMVLQFTIDTTPVTLVGLVTAIDYNETNNTSILHIETEIVPVDIRNLIRCMIFGILEDAGGEPGGGEFAGGEPNLSAAEPAGGEFAGGETADGGAAAAEAAGGGKNASKETEIAQDFNDFAPSPPQFNSFTQSEES